MKKIHLTFATILLLVMGIVLGFASTNSATKPSTDSKQDSEQRETTDDPFDKMMQALTHKRCVNCHPAGDRPRQGEDSHYHNFGVQRGPDNHGVAALKCASCHQEENNDFSGVPGAPEWSLAPLSMGWEGLNRVEIAQSILDPARNGGRSLKEIVKHLTEHELVLWAWEPGVDASGAPREKPPIGKEEYIQAVKDWAAAGAIIPQQ
ncbi:MAG: hypothetical protein AAGD05_04720 [Bacteroidota bacterium]